MKKIIKNIKIDNIIMIFIGILAPWSILFATPQLHIGYWGQVEGMITFNHFVSALVALLLIRIGIIEKEVRQYFVHPVVLLPLLIGIYSLISAFFQMLPVLALYGSPQLGQGAFGYFSLSLLTVLYLYLLKFTKFKYYFLLNIIIICLVITVGSFYPVFTGVVISFFGFNDWLAIYYVALMIYLLILVKNINLFINKELLGFILFLFLGPLFWKIDNNSSIALWIIISFAWIYWFIISYFKINIKIFNKFIFNPIFFTFIPILLSLVMVLSSFILWDGKTDMTNEISDKWGHLATLVARGSIVRVLFDHLDSIKSLLFGFGWGSISELLLKSFTPEVFYQINTGNRVHFHTHNELFEHIFSIGLVGGFLYVLYIYNIFKCSFKLTISYSFLWLIYFCIGAFWFQWISNISIQAMLAAFLININFKPIKYVYWYKFSKLFNSIYFYSGYLLIVAIFLFYGAYIGLYTAIDHQGNYRANSLIANAKESKLTGNCSKGFYDFGKGGMQFSQKFNGFNNYYKDQVMIYGFLNDSDYDVLEWNLCASDNIINKKQASLELINVHINTLSMLSVLPGKYGVDSRIRMKPYIDLWEDKVKFFLSYAPKRVDQAIPLISYYLKNANDIGVKNICNYIEINNVYQGFCDLAMGSIYLKEGNMKKGMMLIERANNMGVLDSEHVDRETSEELKKLLKNYKY
ncbi:MAG: hypothetical protein CMJ11_00120 [Pelagibacterales bacterium]|nr:hypothetical protein [Pelagibacterales bacterium]|tara:strand:+ start:16096 stop:18168 length:2073 start_codon:yes stop_codon:yes gene_type:complete